MRTSRHFLIDCSPSKQWRHDVILRICLVYHYLFKSSCEIFILEESSSYRYLSRVADNQRIMVVDDNSDIVQVVQGALRKWNLVSDGFTNPEIALKHFEQHKDSYALVISDARMPEMSGFTFLEKITEMKPTVKVMMLTAFFPDMLDIPKVLRGILKIDAILEKPVGIKSVCTEVRKQLKTG